jgi:hypothetical protein
VLVFAVPYIESIYGINYQLPMLFPAVITTSYHALSVTANDKEAVIAPSLNVNLKS